MIKRKEEMKTREVDCLMDGQGRVSFLDIFDKEEMLGLARLFAIVTLEQGCSIGSHIHKGEAEIFLLLEGAAQTLDNGEWVELRKGDAAFTREGYEHSLRNPYKETVKLLAVIIEGDSC
ncbi:MAG TPA: cupin domain-containing protein [Clostridia bacterium]|nr:cupin domain-containing protein [Clostridia bacterium]